MKKTESRITDSSQAGLASSLTVEVLRCIIDSLHPVDRIALALTSKFFAELLSRSKQNPHINNDGTILQMEIFNTTADKFEAIRSGRQAPVTEVFASISTRRLLLLRLKEWGWIPSDHRLCWVCSKYTKTSGTKWHKLVVPLRYHHTNNESALLLQNLFPERLYCHHTCMKSSGDLLKGWLSRFAGVSHVQLRGRWREKALAFGCNYRSTIIRDTKDTDTARQNGWYIRKAPFSSW